MEFEFKNIRQYLNYLGNTLVNNYRNNLKNRNVDATGKLGNTLSFKVVSEDGVLAVDLSLEDYWKYVEYGRQAGKFPPISSIKEWIKVKPVIPNIKNGHLPTVEELSYLISRKIAQKGILPRPILSDSIDELDINKIEEALTRDLNVSADKLILIVAK